MEKDHQFTLVGQRTAEGNRLTMVVAQMKVGTCRPVAHAGDLRIRLMRTETRQTVDHVGAGKVGQNIPTVEDRQEQSRQRTFLQSALVVED